MSPHTLRVYIATRILRACDPLGRAHIHSRQMLDSSGLRTAEHAWYSLVGRWQLTVCTQADSLQVIEESDLEEHWKRTLGASIRERPSWLSLEPPLLLHALSNSS